MSTAASTSNASPLSPSAVVSAWRAVGRDSAIAGLLSLLVLAPTVVELAASWQSNRAYQYAWLVLPMFVYLLGWHHRAQLLNTLPRPDFAGVVVALVAALAWSLAAAANIDVGRQLALVAVLQAIALAALGRALYVRLLPVMGLLLLLLPSADLLVGPLRLLTARTIEWIARWSGLPCQVEGYAVHIGENSYIVLEACAGLAQFTLTTFLGYCFGLLVFRSWCKIVAVALLCALLGVLANVLRVGAIVWIDWTRGYTMDLAAHARIQWVALLLVLAGLFYVLTRIRGDLAPPSPLPAALPPPSRFARHAPLVAGAAVLLIVALARVLLDAVPLRAVASPARLPAAIGSWRLAAPPGEWAVYGPTQELRALTLNYRSDDRNLGVRLIETRVAGAKLLPERLLGEAPAGWLDIAHEARPACDATRCVRLVHEVWQDAEGRARHHVYYGYSIGGFQTASQLALRLASALARLAGSDAPARLVALTAEGEAPMPGELSIVYRALDAALGGAGA